MRSTSTRRGLTLPEILISTGILGIVLLGVYSLLIFSLRWNRKMSDTVHVYQSAVKATTRLKTDLNAGSSLSFIYEVDGLAFASARPPSGPFKLDPTNRLLYYKYVIYYVDGGTLYRNEVALPTPTSSPATITDLNMVKALMTGQGQVMAENVSDLEISPGSGASVKFKVTGDQTPETNSITIQTRISFRE